MTAGGPHVVRVEADGYDIQDRTVSIVAGETRALDFDLEKFPGLAPWTVELGAGPTLFFSTPPGTKGSPPNGGGTATIARALEHGVKVFGRALLHSETYRATQAGYNAEILKLSALAGAGYTIGDRLSLTAELAVGCASVLKITDYAHRTQSVLNEWTRTYFGFEDTGHLLLVVEPSLSVQWAFTRNFYLGLRAPAPTTFYERGRTISFIPMLLIGGAFGTSPVTP